jgi:signal transduction histidine kinase
MVRELEEHQEQLLQARKLAALGTLTSGVAHEINNPLANILTSAQILSEELEDGGAAYKRKLLANIEEQTKRARDIVRNLLEFSRKRSFGLQKVKLADLIEATLMLVRGNAAKGIRFSVSAPESLPEVEVDKQRIQQALLNVVMNAVDSMPGGGNLAIEAGLAEEEGMVQITVSDTGTGILPEHLSKVFDPFFTTKEAGRGTGLGLSVSYGIIRQHHGRITVTSKPGEGTTFKILLPIEAPSGLNGMETLQAIQSIKAI